jgi:hypothetical protein
MDDRRRALARAYELAAGFLDTLDDRNRFGDGACQGFGVAYLTSL